VESGESTGGPTCSPSAPQPTLLLRPLQRLRQSFFDLCSEHCERLISGWQELQSRLTQLTAALRQLMSTGLSMPADGPRTSAPLTAVIDAIESAVRGCMQRVRQEAGSEEEEEAEEAFNSLQAMQQKWKGMAEEESA
jgi:hypothetical protein